MPLLRPCAWTSHIPGAPARILPCMGSLRMDIWRQTRESAIGRAVTRTRPSVGDEVTAAKWYGQRPMPAILRPSITRHAGSPTAATR